MYRSVIVACLSAALLVGISNCGGGGGSPTTPTPPATQTPTRALLSLTIAEVSGEKTATGYAYRFQTRLQESRGVAAAVTSVVMAFFQGTQQFATVNRTTDIPSAQIAGNATGTANWTITDDNAGNPYGTRVQITVTYTDSTGAQTVAGSADIPALPMSPVTFSVCGTVRDGSLGLSDAQVSIVGVRSTTTDGQGRYCFSDVAAGTILLRVSRSGYQNSERSISLTGNTTADFALTSNAPSNPSPTIDDFRADSTSITAGQSTTLRWSVSNATSVSINSGIGNVSASGTRSISPSSTTTYRLTATNNNGTVNRDVTVNVGTSSGGIPICTQSTPAGVTAVCNNGQTSMSQNRSGTCSSNGGVACWVCPGPLCNP